MSGIFKVAIAMGSWLVAGAAFWSAFVLLRRVFEPRRTPESPAAEQRAARVRP